MMGLDGVPSRLKTPVTDFVLQKSQGGGWCNSTESCSERKMTEFGSSKLMEAVEFTGILSNRHQENPGIKKLLPVILSRSDFELSCNLYYLLNLSLR